MRELGLNKLKIRLRWLVIAGLVAYSGLLAADQAYSSGFQAYLDGDYTLAEKYWLVAASEQDARSMFNLGLLYEQKRVAKASQGRARSLFEASAELGYAPAAFHLANILLNEGKHSDKAQGLLKFASDAGFAPAKQRLSELASSNNPSQIESAASSSNSSEVNYRSEAWLNGQKASAWTIQVLAFAEIVKVREFIDKYSLSNKAAYFRDASGDKVLYKLVYGVYRDREQADVARKTLSSDLAQYGPWLRSIDSVQSAMKSQK